MTPTKKLPDSFEEALIYIKQELSDQELMEFMRSSYDDLIKYHHSMGRWIRNHWNLWYNSQLFHDMESLGFTHPDDMSSAIIKELWNRLNKVPSTLEKDAADYATFWEDKNAKY